MSKDPGYADTPYTTSCSCNKKKAVTKRPAPIPPSGPGVAFGDSHPVSNFMADSFFITGMSLGLVLLGFMLGKFL